jgi:hypothetical protein
MPRAGSFCSVTTWRFPGSAKLTSGGGCTGLPGAEAVGSRGQGSGHSRARCGHPGARLCADRGRPGWTGRDDSRPAPCPHEHVHRAGAGADNSASSSIWGPSTPTSAFLRSNRRWSPRTEQSRQLQLVAARGKRELDPGAPIGRRRGARQRGARERNVIADIRIRLPPGGQGRGAFRNASAIEPGHDGARGVSARSLLPQSIRSAKSRVRKRDRLPATPQVLNFSLARHAPAG